MEGPGPPIIWYAMRGRRMPYIALGLISLAVGLVIILVCVKAIVFEHQESLQDRQALAQ